MRFGIALESFTPPGKIPDIDSIYRMAELGELFGFDSVWAWDHILLGSKKVFPVLDCPTVLAAVGSRTRRMNVGSSVLILALRNPIALAKTLSTIQFLTRGRLVVGAASGWYEREFRAVGVNYSNRGSIFERRFVLIRKLLNESDVSYDSDGFSIEHASMEPKSTQKVPMLVGGYSDSVLARAGRIGDGWISYYYTAQGFQDSWMKVAMSARENGRDPGSMRKINIVPLSISTNYEKGDSIARDFTNRYMDLPKNTGCTAESAIKGTPAECIDQIKKYEEAGVEDLVFIPSFYEMEMVEKAGKEILPVFLK